ncbi:recombinase family protein [Rufibacter hautae]|uniref:Recombinase family protein n=1 Tax=Rufibacter hautae TaxID=2595005 RepID=A0A5B6TTQ3_9BACT|nr:recombinase family protein [Rufibacter hautae]KAA3439898.1 recombinase family protein [Rufibacter hautae]
METQLPTTAETKYVAYYRVSTSKQGESGLGLAAQQNAVNQCVRDPQLILASFTEIESGKKNNRQELEKAISYANAQSARLIIAKLDRLSRDQAFIHTLRNTGVDFICADMPDANTLTIGVFAAVGQHERETISKRTKEALHAKKLREPNWKPGTPANLTDEARMASLDTRRRNAQQNVNNRRAAALVRSLRERKDEAGNAPTWREIAEELNRHGFKTSRGGSFQATQAMRLFKPAIED